VQDKHIVAIRCSKTKTQLFKTIQQHSSWHWSDIRNNWSSV